MLLHAVAWLGTRTVGMDGMKQRSVMVSAAWCLVVGTAALLCVHCEPPTRPIGDEAAGMEPVGGSDVTPSGGTSSSAGTGNRGGGAGTGDVQPTSGAGGNASGGSEPSAGSSPTAGSAGSGGSDTAGDVGVACSGDGDCSLGHCIDGVCCESDCKGCNACATDFTGKADGVCAPVVDGQDPHDACADETATNECGNDGSCNGAGVCRKVSSSHVCKAASCSSGKFTGQSTCDGSGTCQTPAPEDCGAYPCATTGCAKTCSTQQDCSASSYCKLSGATGTCTAKQPNGTTATQAFECTSGVVADGVCCDQACTGCKACSGSPLTNAAAGQCSNVVAGKVAHSACTNSGKTCGNDGMCDGTGACRSTPKQGESCDPGNACISGSTCNAGQCSGGTTKTCNSPPTCKTGGSCNPANGQCTYTDASGTTCNDNNACTTNDKCSSGTCGGTAITCNSPAPCQKATTCSGAGQCNYPNANDGVTDASCPANQGKLCFQGACVKCLQDTDCPTTTNPTCSNHDCVCRQYPGNLVVNPNFDGNLNGWDNGGYTFVFHDDKEMCAQSKSVFAGQGGTQGFPSQCIQVAPSKKYYWALWYTGGGSPGDSFSIDFYGNANCTGTYLGSQSIVTIDPGMAPNWVSDKVALTSPAGAQSVLMTSDMYLRGMDQVYFGTQNVTLQ